MSKKIQSSAHTLTVVSEDDLLMMWEKLKNDAISSNSIDDVRNIAGQVPVAMDANNIRKLIKDLGINGKVEIKTVGGKQYAIFKGNAAKRTIFNGTRYLATNPKVVEMAIGNKGVTNSIISGAKLTIYLTVPLRTLSILLGDQPSMHRLIGTVATDIVKVGIAALVAKLAAAVVGAFVTTAAGPIVAAVVLGFLTAVALDKLDQKFGITEGMIELIEEAEKNTFGKLAEQVRRYERNIINQALGQLKGSGLGRIHY